MPNHKKGYTIIETLLSITLGFGVMTTLMVIPNQMRLSHYSYQDEARYNHGHTSLSLAIQEDISRYLLIEKNEAGFSIGNCIYRFTESGVYRKEGEREVLLTDIPLTYTMDATHVTITDAVPEIRNEGNKTPFFLSFPLKNSTLMHPEWGEL